MFLFNLLLLNAKFYSALLFLVKSASPSWNLAFCNRKKIHSSIEWKDASASQYKIYLMWKENSYRIDAHQKINIKFDKTKVKCQFWIIYECSQTGWYKKINETKNTLCSKFILSRINFSTSSCNNWRIKTS